MRNALISALLVIFLSSLDYTGIGPNFTIDLRKPTYFLVDKSFWYQCENDPDGYEACRTYRIRQINDGFNDWFDHFDVATRPKAVIVFSQDDLPESPTYNLIHLKIEEGHCGMATPTEIAVACHYKKTHTIVFNLPKHVTSPIFAHELGHALQRNRTHDDMPKDTYSIMSYTLEPNHVLPIDIKILCKMHPECPPHEDTWCWGGFWDKDRCPSVSYEEGEKMFRALKKTTSK